MTITTQLRQLTIDCKLSQRKLAEASGVPESAVNSFRRGGGLNSVNIDRLAEYFGVRLTKPRKARA